LAATAWRSSARPSARARFAPASSARSAHTTWRSQTPRVIGMSGDKSRSIARCQARRTMEANRTPRLRRTLARTLVALVVLETGWLSYPTLRARLLALEETPARRGQRLAAELGCFSCLGAAPPRRGARGARRRDRGRPRLLRLPRAPRHRGRWEPGLAQGLRARLLGRRFRRPGARRRRATDLDREGRARARRRAPDRRPLLQAPGDQDAGVRALRPRRGRGCARRLRALDPCRQLEAAHSVAKSTDPQHCQGGRARERSRL